MRLRIALVASLVAGVGLAGGGARAHVLVPLRVDLSDPEGVGIDLLPGICDDEIAMLGAVAGPGPEGLAERLSECGIPHERLREWAPYLILSGSTESADRWELRASLSGEGARLTDGRMRIAFRTGEARWSGGLRGDPALGMVSVGSVEVAIAGLDLTAGSVGGGVVGGDPWTDPVGIRGSRSATIPVAAVRSGEKIAAEGVCIKLPGVCGLDLWRDRTAGEGVVVSGSLRERFGIAGGGSARGGKGLTVRLAGRNAVFRSSFCIAKGKPASIAFDAAPRERGRGRLRVAWTLGSRPDGLQGRVEGVVLGRARSFRCQLAGSALGPARAGRPSFSEDVLLTCSGPWGSGSVSLAWGAVGATAKIAGERCFPIPGAGDLRAGGSVVLSGPASREAQLRLAWVRGGAQIRGTSSPLSSRSAGLGVWDAWKWTLAGEQIGGK